MYFVCTIQTYIPNVCCPATQSEISPNRVALLCFLPRISATTVLFFFLIHPLPIRILTRGRIFCHPILCAAHVAFVFSNNPLPAAGQGCPSCQDFGRAGNEMAAREGEKAGAMQR